MSQRPEFTSPTLPASPAPTPGPEVLPEFGTPAELGRGPGLEASENPGKRDPQRIPRWLERSELFLRVLLRMYIGLAVCYAPWSRMFWDQNPVFVNFPMLGSFATHGAVRGLVSGLGLLNLWIAFQDAIRRRDG